MPGLRVVVSLRQTPLTPSADRRGRRSVRGKGRSGSRSPGERRDAVPRFTDQASRVCSRDGRPTCGLTEVTLIRPCESPRCGFPHVSADLRHAAASLTANRGGASRSDARRKSPACTHPTPRLSPLAMVPHAYVGGHCLRGSRFVGVLGSQRYDHACVDGTHDDPFPRHDTRPVCDRVGWGHHVAGHTKG